MAYTEKVGKTWRVRWQTAERLPNGRFKEDSESGFRTQKAALVYGRAQEDAIRAGTWVDPERGKISLDDYWKEWIDAQDVADSTLIRYRSYYKNHLGPKWGDDPIASIGVLQVDKFKKELLEGKKLKPGTVNPIIELLGRMLTDAEFDRRIGHSPVRPADRRRGQRKGDVEDDKREGIAVTLEQLLEICARLPSHSALLVLTTAFTGMRWGEAAGMRRSFLFLQPADEGTPAYGWYEIDKKIGALHEDNGTLSFGPPKSRKTRTVELPPFLVELLLTHLEEIPAEQDLLFPCSTGEGYRRSNFARQQWRPACDGWASKEPARNHRGVEAAPPIVATLRFHDLRHTQETWLQEDLVPKVARDARIGHYPKDLEAIYGHVTPIMKRQVLDVLESRWATGRAVIHGWRSRRNS